MYENACLTLINYLVCVLKLEMSVNNVLSINVMIQEFSHKFDGWVVQTPSGHL